MEKNCDKCKHIAPNKLKCTGGFAPIYGWCSPVEKGAENCPRFDPK